MYIDSRLQVSRQQAITANAASTDTIDFGSDRDVGPGEPLWLVLASRAAPGGTSPTLAVAVQTDDNSAFSSAATLVTSPTFAAADLALGKMQIIPMPMTNERHLRLNYTVGGTSPTFSLDAWLTNQDPQTWVSLPDGI
jgi:hypothetical protein